MSHLIIFCNRHLESERVRRQLNRQAVKEESGSESGGYKNNSILSIYLRKKEKERLRAKSNRQKYKQDEEKQNLIRKQTKKRY